MQNFFQSVYEVVAGIPRGKVLSYGDVAKRCGNPRMARQVGWALHVNPRPGEVPWHRVVFADGSLASGFAFGGRDIQRALHEGEGVRVSDDYKVDMAAFRWQG